MIHHAQKLTEHLPSQGSNLETEIQSLVCYQLHHRAINPSTTLRVDIEQSRGRRGVEVSKPFKIYAFPPGEWTVAEEPLPIVP